MLMQRPQMARSFSQQLSPIPRAVPPVTDPRGTYSSIFVAPEQLPPDSFVYFSPLPWSVLLPLAEVNEYRNRENTRQNPLDVLPLAGIR
jgi:hypothetical protein